MQAEEFWDIIDRLNIRANGNVAWSSFARGSQGSGTLARGSSKAANTGFRYGRAYLNFTTLQVSPMPNGL